MSGDRTLTLLIGSESPGPLPRLPRAGPTSERAPMSSNCRRVSDSGLHSRETSGHLHPLKRLTASRQEVACVRPKIGRLNAGQRT